MKRLISAMLTALALMVLMAATALGNHPGDRNCPDFDSQAHAQGFFERHGGSPSNNVDGLDRDNDGVACENNDYGSNAPRNDDDDEDGNEPNEPAPQDPDEEDPGELPESSTAPVGPGATMTLLLTVLGLGTFGMMLRRRLGVRL